MEGWYRDNRCSSRYAAIKTPVYLGWWEEPEFRTCPAELKNLSHGGALVLVATQPPEAASLWLCLAKTPPSEWVEVTVVTVATPQEDLHELRLKFSESCPYEMFNTAVLGISAEA
jgi:hypothetical protein